MNYNIRFNSEKLGNDLKVFQMQKGRTLKEISHNTGIGISTLSRIRNGKENALFLEVAILAFEMRVPLERYREEKKNEK